MQQRLRDISWVDGEPGPCAVCDGPTVRHVRFEDRDRLLLCPACVDALAIQIGGPRRRSMRAVQR